MHYWKSFLTAGACALGLAVAGPALAQDPSAPATYEEVNLNSGFIPDPYDVAVTAGGPNDAASIDDSCNGWVASAPDVTLAYDAGSFPLYLSVTSDADTTLVVNAPDGIWHCNDDYDLMTSTNPAVVFETPQAGLYSIWIGSYSSSTEFPDATLHISELGVQQSELDYTLEPMFGSIALDAGFSDDPRTFDVVIGGSGEPVNASDYGEGCFGDTTAAPTLRLTYDAGVIFPLHISAVSDEADTTLIVRDPSGNWVCDDDSGEGTNSQLTFESPEGGTYDIWVGSFFSFFDGASEATILISELGPAGDAAADSYDDVQSFGEPSFGQVALNAGFKPDPYVFSLQAGGIEDAGELDDSCRGNVSLNPDYRIDYGGGERTLYISASSDTDTTIVVYGPDGEWYCNDDYFGLNPAVEIPEPQSGAYNIWVGTYSDQPDYPPATLHISEIEAQF